MSVRPSTLAVAIVIALSAAAATTQVVASDDSLQSRSSQACGLAAPDEVVAN